MQHNYTILNCDPLIITMNQPIFSLSNQVEEATGLIQGSLSKIQGLLKTVFTVFKDKMFRKNTDPSVKILLQRC